MNFGDRLCWAIDRVGTPLGMGLDPHLDRLPQSLQERFKGKSGRDFALSAADAVILEFNAMALSAAKGRIAYVKPQFAFYEQLGSPGWAALETTIQMAHDAGMIVVGDAKRGDISSTAAAYARAILDDAGPLGCDAVTLSPWMGMDTLEPFLPYCRESGKGVFVLARTTNPMSALFQTHGEPRAVDNWLQNSPIWVRNSSERVAFHPSVQSLVRVRQMKQKRRDRMPSAWF